MPTSIPPLLLLFFNRPDLTQKLISILRSIRPPKIYIAIDGPRAEKPDDIKKVQEVREIARSIDWTTQVQFLIRETNLGCGKGPSSAISWFFEHEEQGIILEDDIHPSADFFSFCQEMLTLYADEHRVATIMGHSFVPSTLRHPNGYFFSRYFQGWGWATWRRFWKTYDFYLTSLPPEEWEKIIKEKCEGNLETAYWLLHLSKIAIAKKWEDVWDYQAQFCIWRNHQFNIIAGNNLISNEGCRPDATHCIEPINHASRKIIPLKGPFKKQPIEEDLEIDRRSFMWQYIMGDSHLIHILRLIDPAYASLNKENQKLKKEIEEIKLH